MHFTLTPLSTMQEGHASVCAVCPQHMGCILVNAAIDSSVYPPEPTDGGY
jgi:hypothetical protein